MAVQGKVFVLFPLQHQSSDKTGAQTKRAYLLNNIKSCEKWKITLIWIILKSSLQCSHASHLLQLFLIYKPDKKKWKHDGALQKRKHINHMEQRVLHPAHFFFTFLLIWANLHYCILSIFVWIMGYSFVRVRYRQRGGRACRVMVSAFFVSSAQLTE